MLDPSLPRHYRLRPRDTFSFSNPRLASQGGDRGGQAGGHAVEHRRLRGHRHRRPPGVRFVCLGARRAVRPFARVCAAAAAALRPLPYSERGRLHAGLGSLSFQAANQQLKGSHIREGQVLHLPPSYGHRRGGATSTRQADEQSSGIAP